MRIRDFERYVRFIGAGGGALLLLAAMLVFAPAVGWSQETPPAEPAPTPAPAAAPDEATPEGTNIGFEEEVTVTARKLGEETVQDVPISVAAPSEEQLRNRGAQTTRGRRRQRRRLHGAEPRSRPEPGGDARRLRGPDRARPAGRQGAGRRLPRRVGDLAVAVHARPRPLRPEPRRGAARARRAPLFGSGSLSGTVRYITNQPELGRSERDRRAHAQQHQRRRHRAAACKVAVNAPLGDTAALRVTAYYTGYGGFIDAVQPAGRTRTSTTATRAGARARAARSSPTTASPSRRACSTRRST